MVIVDVSSVLLILIAIFFGLTFLVIIAVFITTSHIDMKAHESEKFFKNPKDNSLNEFPSLEEKASCSLSVIVPAFAEEKRLPPMLEECVDYLENRQKSDSTFSYEVIVVDDGSRDKTTDIGLSYSRNYTVDKVRVLTLAENRGKGGAVKMGMLRSRGRYLLFADADGATKFGDLEKLETSMKELAYDPEREPAIVVGSRAHLEKESIASRSLFRTILMHGFHLLVWLLCVRTIKDTQCGFKLFTREAARICFANLHIYRWAFDVEVLYIAEYLKIPLREVAVTWTEIEGSKLTPFWSALQMGRDLCLLWLRYFLGIWKVDSKQKTE